MDPRFLMLSSDDKSLLPPGGQPTGCWKVVGNSDSAQRASLRSQSSGDAKLGHELAWDLKSKEAPALEFEIQAEHREGGEGAVVRSGPRTRVCWTLFRPFRHHLPWAPPRPPVVPDGWAPSGHFAQDAFCRPRETETPMAKGLARGHAVGPSSPGWGRPPGHCLSRPGLRSLPLEANPALGGRPSRCAFFLFLLPTLCPLVPRGTG